MPRTEPPKAFPRSKTRHERRSRHAPGEQCPQCGVVHTTANGGPACVGHRRDGSGRPCRAAPNRGQRVCNNHGGRTPQAKAAAARRLMTAEIHAETQAVLAAEGLQGVSDPIGELGLLAVEALAMKRALGARVNALSDIRYTGGLERDEDGELHGTGTEQTRAELLLYERAIDRSARLLELVVKHSPDTPGDDTRAMLSKLGQALGL